MTIAGEAVPATRLFAASYDPKGEPVDVPTYPMTGQGEIAGVAAAADNALIMTGVFMGSVDFGQGVLAALGERDAFVARVCR
jgi:hypothetical protein